MAEAPLLEIGQLRVSFDGLPVLHGIDLTLERGEALGIVGESGCGKSVTFLAGLGLLANSAAASGRFCIDGQNLLGLNDRALARIRGRRVALIFQDPASSLNPVRRIGSQIGEAITLHRGLSGGAAEAEVVRLLEHVGMPDPRGRLSMYPHELSGGQNQRAMIAMALAGEPDLLVADEPTTALDVTIQAQILDLLQRLRAETGMALVLISHDLGVVAQTCARVAVMYAGRIVEHGPAANVLDDPSHPYTQGLLRAIPPLSGPRRPLASIPGGVPRPGQLPTGCAFAPRCEHTRPACEASVPNTVAVTTTHGAACLRVREPAL